MLSYVWVSASRALSHVPASASMLSHVPGSASMLSHVSSSTNPSLHSCSVLVISTGRYLAENNV